MFALISQTTELWVVHMSVLFLNATSPERWWEYRALIPHWRACKHAGLSPLAYRSFPQLSILVHPVRGTRRVQSKYCSKITIRHGVGSSVLYNIAKPHCALIVCSFLSHVVSIRLVSAAAGIITH